MHYQVPQYLDVEDKIIGPLTLKQFIILLLGGGVLFLLYSTLRFSVFIILSFPIAFFALLLAFYKKDNQKFGKFISNLFSFLSKPNMYTWKRGSFKSPAQKPIPKIIKKTIIKKEPPKQDELSEAQWKVEL